MDNVHTLKKVLSKFESFKTSDLKCLRTMLLNRSDLQNVHFNRKRLLVPKLPIGLIAITL